VEANESNKMSVCNVYLSKYPFPFKKEIFCQQRREEIEKCRNSSVKEQKMYVWKLLEYALSDTFGLDISKQKFQKKKSGKWILDGCYFSLSHSGNIITVAISDSPVGIDVQIVKKLDQSQKFKGIILSEKEKKKFRNISDERLLKMWSLKECAFKQSDDSNFIPSRYSIDDIPKGVTFKFGQGKDKYILSLLCDNVEKADYYSLIGEFKTSRMNSPRIKSINITLVNI
jgi:phosphopantetheinyl transferase